MANLGNTIVNGILRVNGKINSSDSIVAPSFTGNLTGTASIEHYGTCSTAAATTEKAVTCSTFKLLTGAKINVKFTVTNTASNPTLNVNGTGAKAIYYRNSAIPAGYLAVNRTYAFIYNGTQYELVGDINVDTNTDTKVTNTLNTTTKAYITGTTSATTNTGTQIFDTGVYLDTTAGTLTATKFNGSLSGNATSATKATTADKLTTARTINGVSFDGSANITVADSTKLPLTGGTLTGNLGINASNVASVRSTEQLVSHGVSSTGIFWGASIKNNNNSDAKNYGSGLKLRNGSASEDNKWSGIAAVASSSYSNSTDLVLYASQAARMRITTNDLVPEANSVSNLGSSALKWKNIYATTFTGTLSGNASTATKLATARTIATTGAVTGSATFDGSGNVSLATTARGCVVGQNGSTTTNPYYKFASLSISVGNEDRSITFKVSKGYGDSSTSVGILTAHFRTTQNGYWASGELKWEYAASGIDVSDFILAHNSSASPTIVELWVKVASAFTHYHFDVISESTRTGRNNALWTLYNTSSAGSVSAITSGYTQVASTLLTLKNPISGNASLVSSTSANPTASSSYALAFHSGASTGSKSLLNNDGLTYISLQGTTSAVGNSILQLGNGIASGTAGNKSGRLRIFSASSGYTDIVPTSSTNNYTLTLPSATGTVALTSSSITGNAATADKLKTARKINGVSFDGTKDINITVADSTKLPLAGGTLTGNLKFADVTSTTYPAVSNKITWAGSTDGAEIFYEVQASDKGMLVLRSLDDENAGAIFRNSKSGKEVTILNGNVTAGTFTGSLSGNALSASSVVTTLTDPTTGTWYYPTWVSATSGNLGQRVNNGYKYYALQGTAGAVGHSYLQLGNAIASGTAGNKQGHLRIYNASSGYTDLANTTSTTNYTITLPAANGTVALTSSSITGNSATSTKLQTARKIDGVSFDGSTDIIHYGTCSTAAATVAKTVACAGFTLTTGAWIAVKFTVTNTGAVGSLTLNVNNTGAKNIKYRNGNIPSTGYLAANRTYMFVYDGTYYQIVGDLDTNTNTYDRTLYSQRILAETAITANNIIVGNNGKYNQLNSGKAFDISYPILYAASAIAASATGTNNYICIPFAVTNTQNITLTAYKPVYIKGKLSGNSFTPVSKTPLTQAIPTSSDGYHYLYLGTAYTTDAIHLDYSHELYAYVGNAFSRVAAGSGGDFVASKDKSIANFVAMTETEYNSSASSLPDKTAVIITDGGYVTTQATSLTCELPLDL